MKPWRNRIEELKRPKWERENMIEVIKEETKEEAPAKTGIDYLYLAFNLLPIQGGRAAIAPGAVTDVECLEGEDMPSRWMITLHGGKRYFLTDDEMAELETTIRARAVDNEALKREAFKNQMLMQASVGQELQGGIAPVRGNIIDPTRRR